MGVLANTKQFLANKITNVAQKTADGIASSSALSPKQMLDIEKKRMEYLSAKPDMDDEEAQEFIQRNLGAVGVDVYQAYLEQLKELYKPVDLHIDSFNSNNRIRWFDIEKWVSDSEEKNLDKLVNVYQVLSEEDCNIALIYDRKMGGCNVSLGVVNTDERQSDPSKSNIYINRLASALSGNFPGVEIRKDSDRKSCFKQGIPKCLEKVTVEGENTKSVAIVSNLASEKSEGFISQSMEKLLDGIVPKSEDEEYTIVLLAKPIVDQLGKKNRLFEMYSALNPYASWQTNYTYNTSDDVSSSFNFGVNLGASAGIQKSYAVSDGQNRAQLYQENPNDGKWKKFKKKVKGGFAKGLGQYSGIQDTHNETNTNGYQATANFGVNFSRSSNISVQMGVNDGITQNYVNYGVQHTLEILESQLKRLEESAALGMWEFAAYFIAENPVVANNVAHMYLALTQGDESYMTRAAVNLYDGEKERNQADVILRSVQRLQHPIFGLNDTLDDEWLLYPTLVSPSADLSGKELAKSLNFPRKSVSGLPVLECVSFGREVQRFTDDNNEENNIRTVTVGNIYHMRHCESIPVNFDVNSFASHVFVTGSTGTGKSNTIYQLLDKLQEQRVKFLVVEPAKGEYKKIFGGKCKVYGTNPSHSELLCVNPFSFPEGIHVLEHIDRLVEIFNACWPMYAAMPAVLKDAMEKSYEKKGWNLKYSKCEPRVFPTFVDLINQLPEVMNSSLYSEDTKSDYSGALITRVHSLTNGINGEIFCSFNELTAEDLFENNVIIDLSRVGSNETKSLLMGIIVMKLQEYRLHLDKMNEKLLHVTVLEEAHNLLRKTSMGQAQESANLQGKSVEMITNSIAEMRTFGEGFIIADQAPDLLDEAVIRNTNTKIVLRLPDETDRKIVGGAMALNENQINELAKLPRGVAAVYQNDWIEAVLCKFMKYDKMQPLEYYPKDITFSLQHYFMRVFGIKDNYEMKSEDVDNVNKWLNNLKCSDKTYALLNKSLKGNVLNEEEKKTVAYNVFEGKKIALMIKGGTKDNINKKVDLKIGTYIDGMDSVLIERIRNSIFEVINRFNCERRSTEMELRAEDIRRMRI